MVSKSWHSNHTFCGIGKFNFNGRANCELNSQVSLDIIIIHFFSNGRRKLHYLYQDQTELVEELDINTDEVLLRKWKRPNPMGKEEWDYEIGDDPTPFNPESDLLTAAKANVSRL